MLRITNGDCAAEVLSRAVSGTILPWRDVLHEGPVRAGLELEELSRERAAFIAQAGWGEEERVVEDFRSRDVAFEAEYLGTMAAERAAELFALRSPVTRRHLREAQAAWAAFRSANPKHIESLKPAALPFLAAARAALARGL